MSPASSTALRQRPALREVTSLSNSQAGPNVVVLSDPQGAAAEAIRALRTRVQSEHLQLGRRALAVCAASPGVGCSFVAVNLAVALAQIGVKTLLVDANLRSPAVHTYFGQDELTDGLATCLADREVSLDECVRRDVQPGLDVIPAGNVAGGTQELLAGARFAEIMNSCFRDYDMTIVDTAPARSSSDCLLVANGVGFALLVARKNKSFVSDLRTLSRQIRAERAEVIGTVLNGN
jgi:tyrosine-protein kinase Etk/Wzc